MISKKLAQGLRLRLQSIALGITGRNIKVIEIPSGEDDLGYTSQGNEIHLSFSNPIMKDMSNTEQVMFIKGVFAHELMHQEATDFAYAKDQAMKLPPNERGIFQTICNIVEDPAIEYLSPHYIGGHLLKALSFSVMQLYKISPEIANVSPFNQFITAAIQYGDGGFLKGDFYSQEAKTCFFKSLPLFDKAIEELDARKRIDYSKEIFEITRPLWEEDLKNLSDLQKLLDEIEEILGRNGKNLNDSGGSPNNQLSPQDADSSQVNKSVEKKKQRRRVTLHRITEEEAEKMGLNESQSSTELPDGDLDLYIVEGKEPRKSDKGENEIGMSENENSTSEGESGENSVSENSVSKDENPDSSSSDADSDNSNNQNDVGKQNNSSEQNAGPTDQKSSCGSDKVAQHCDSGVDDEYEISEEEFVLTDEDVREMKDEIEDILYTSEEKVDSFYDEPLDIPELSDSYGGVSCENIRVSVSPSPYITKTYEDIKETMSDGINSLTNQLKRIFKNDVGEKQYSNSGRLNHKRLNSGKMTTRVFDKRKNPANKADLCITLLIDESGSMHGSKANCARNAAIGLAETFSTLNVPTCVIGFTTANSGVAHYHYLHWKNTAAERLKLLNISGRACNFDGYSIRYASKLTEKRPEEHKLMIVISDGLPSFCRGKSDAVADAAQAIREVGKKMDIIGVAVGNTDTEKLYALWKNNFLHISNTKQLYDQLGKKIKEKIKRW